VWRRTRLRDLVELHTEQLNPQAKSEILSIFEHYSLPAFDAGARPGLELGADIKSNKFTIPDGAILLSKLNPRFCRVWEPLPFRENVQLASTEFLVLKPRNGVNRRFLRYLLQSPSFRIAMTGRVTGTSGSHQRVRPDAALAIPVSVPEPSIQLWIGELLGAFDDKIELNRRTSETLEAMFRAVFARCIRGCETSDWERGVLGDFAKEVRDKVAPTELDGSTPYIGLEHMPRKRINLDSWGTAEKVTSEKHRFAEDDVLFGKLRPYFHKAGIALLDGVCSTDIAVIRPLRPFLTAFVLGHVSSEEFISFTDRSSTGTRMPRTNWKTMASYPLIVPPVPFLKQLNEELQPMVSRLKTSTHESLVLTKIRDALIPGLMSGELCVPPHMSVLGKAGL
jgi:type I restriction enzyme S subunit